MRLKAPQGELRWWSIFWLLIGLVLAVLSSIKGDWGTAIFGVVYALAAGLIWLDQKWVAPPLMIWFGLGAIARLIALVTKGVTLLAVLRMLMPVYFGYLVWQWYRSDEPVMAPNSVSRKPTSPFESERADDRWSNPYPENRLDEQ